MFSQLADRLVGAVRLPAATASRLVPTNCRILILLHLCLMVTGQWVHVSPSDKLYIEQLIDATNFDPSIGGLCCTQALATTVVPPLTLNQAQFGAMCS